MVLQSHCNMGGAYIAQFQAHPEPRSKADDVAGERVAHQIVQILARAGICQCQTLDATVSTSARVRELGAPTSQTNPLSAIIFPFRGAGKASPSGSLAVSHAACCWGVLLARTHTVPKNRLGLSPFLNSKTTKAHALVVAPFPPNDLID